MMQSSCNLNLPPISSTSQNIKAYVLTISHSFDTDYFPCNMNSKHLFALASRLFGFCCKLCHCISHHYSITNQEDISKLVVLGIFNIEKKQQPAIIDCGTYFVPYAIICIKCVNSLSFVILFCSVPGLTGTSMLCSSFPGTVVYILKCLWTAFLIT